MPSGENEPDVSWPAVDFAALAEINPDIVAWIYIIYGHHMKNGTMFSGLAEYKKQEFYNAHPVIMLIMPNQNFRVEIFAGYVASVKDNAWEIAMESERKFEAWLTETKESSCFESEITSVVTERVITLSTCSYEFDNARFVLAGRITE